MASKTDLQAEWLRWTGAPDQDTARRIRALSDAGLLPYRDERLNAVHLGQFLLGALAGGQPGDSVAAVRGFAVLRCVSAGDGDPFGLAQDSLFEAIVKALHAPLVIRRLEISPVERTAQLVVGQTLVSAVYRFADAGAEAGDPGLYPVSVVRRIDHRLVQRLLPLIQAEGDA